MANEPRIFSKKVGKQTLTRTVYTSADEVDARFDGFVEDVKADDKKATAGGSAAKSNTGPAGS